MTIERQQPMSEQTITEYLQERGAKVRSRSGRNDHYGSPRDFSFEVRALFANNLGLQITARQYNYRDPWEASGRVNDLVDLTLLHNGQFSELPRGYRFFQGTDTEENIDFKKFTEIIDEIVTVNPKLFTLQSLTGDL